MWQYEQMVYTQTSIRPREWDAQSSLRFWDKNRSPNLGQTTRQSDSYKKKKENLPNSELFRLADHRVKLKESEKSDKY